MGHRLAFTRKSIKTRTGGADIVQAPGETVWGVLYKINDSELAAIDRKEGHDWAYMRVVLPVLLEVGGPSAQRSPTPCAPRSRCTSRHPASTSIW